MVIKEGCVGVAASFALTVIGHSHAHCNTTVETAPGYFVGCSDGREVSDSESIGLGPITTEMVQAGQQAVREGRWISLADLRRELRSQGV